MEIENEISDNLEKSYNFVSDFLDNGLEPSQE